uniref:RING-type E3 ubiquitin transferase n=1 Tax=Anser brachyrhynchus TaxID=132585 RepID=A0A8B9BXY5_9AVES
MGHKTVPESPKSNKDGEGSRGEDVCGAGEAPWFVQPRAEEAEGRPHGGLMATVLDSRCPICLDTWDNASCVMPCLHQFCFRCIQQWVDNKPECPLCKRRVIPGRPATHRLRRPAASRPQAAEPVPTAPVGGLHPYIWASLFRLHPEMLQPLLPWLCQELGQLLGADVNHSDTSIHDCFRLSECPDFIFFWALLQS